VTISRPETHYTSVGDAQVAYQVLGDGPSDLLLFAGLGGHIELMWDDPVSAGFNRRLASLRRRLIFFDRRGTGVSDAVPNSAIPTWEEWTEDIGAVLDAVDSTKTAIMAMIDAGPISVLYSVAHPERVDALVLLNTAAKYLAGDDYAFGASPEAVDALVHLMGTQWGTPEYVKLANPGIDDDRCDLVARTLRSSNTPRTAAAQYDYVLRSVDVRQVLSLIRAPTLVFVGNGLPLLPIDHGRYLADHIEGAKFVELDSGDFNPANQPEMFFEELAEFLTGTRPIAETDRVLASVLFPDIVRSTERAASVGDQRWRAVLDHHDAVVREQLRIFRGREVKARGWLRRLI
jgi:pimeloyl-ACP methyl ester carboxylesterase